MKRSALLGRVCLILATLIWGSSFVLMKFTVSDINPFWLISIRFTIASILFGLISIIGVNRFNLLSKRAFYGSILMGISLSLAYLFQTCGLQYTTPGKNAFITASYCVLVPFVAWLMFKKKPRIVNIIAAVLCFIGIAFVSFESLDSLLSKGDLLTLICGFFFALQIVQTDKYANGQDPLPVTAVMMMSAAATSWIAAFFFAEDIGTFSLNIWINIFYLALMCTGLCYFLQTVGLKYTPHNTAAVLMCLESVFGITFSVLLYNEKLKATTIIGFILIFLSIVMNEALNKNNKM